MDYAYFASLAIAVVAGLALTSIFSMASGRWIVSKPARPPMAALRGGLAILLAWLAACSIGGLTREAELFVVAVCMAFMCGLWIELARPSDRQTAAIEIIVTGLAVSFANMHVSTLGRGLFDLHVPGAIGMPLAIVAVLCVTHCVNRIEVPGFRGWFGFLALAWYAAAALESGLDTQFKTALLLDGAIGGYLLFNVLHARRTGQHVRLGGAGGLMIALALSWIGLDITQGPGRTFPPAAALWVLLFPLMDTAWVLLASLMRGGNILEAEDRHLHTLLDARGYDGIGVLMIVLGISTLFAAVGYFGWRWGVPEPVLLSAASGVFVLYYVAMRNAWRKLAGYTILS